MDKLFNKLPEDIQILIISYIKYPQKSELLEDIRNYKIIKEKLYDKYKNNFININNFTNGEYNELIDMAVTLNIENNLLGYINSEIIYNLYKSLKNIKIMERMLCFRIKREYNGEKITNSTSKYSGIIKIQNEKKLQDKESKGLHRLDQDLLLY